MTDHHSAARHVQITASLRRIEAILAIILKREIYNMVDLTQGLADLNAAITAEDSKLAQSLVILQALPNLIMQAANSTTDQTTAAALETLATHVMNQTATINAANIASGENTLTPPAPPTATPLSITTTSLPDAVVGEAYDETVTVTGGTAPYAFTPSQLGDLTVSQTGEITGTPTTAGPVTLSVEVADASTPAETASATLTVNVDAAAS
jgi:hypothetical protein